MPTYQELIEYDPKGLIKFRALCRKFIQEDKFHDPGTLNITLCGLRLEKGEEYTRKPAWITGRMRQIIRAEEARVKRFKVPFNERVFEFNKETLSKDGHYEVLELPSDLSPYYPEEYLSKILKFLKSKGEVAHDGPKKAKKE